MAQALAHSQARWLIRRALLAREQAAARQQLAVARTDAERTAQEAKLRAAEQAIRALGPDPAPKMG